MDIEEKKAHLRLLQKREKLKQLQQGQQAAPANQYEGKEEAFYQDFGEGIGASALETWEGGKDLLSRTGLVDAPDESDLARLKDWQDDAGQSGWGTAGKIVGDIGQMAAGGGLIGAGLKAATKLPMAMRVATKVPNRLKGLLAQQTAGAAAVGGTQLPETGESRLGNATTEAALTLGPAALMKIGGKAIRGFDKTPEAIAQLAEGIPLTPGMAASNTSIAGIENLMQVIPTAAKARKVAREAAEDSWGQKVMEAAAPKGVKINAPARAGAKELTAAVKQGYTDAWDLAKPLSPSAFKDIGRTLRRTADVVDNKGVGVLKRATADVAKLDKKFSKKGLQSLDNSLRKSVSAAAKSGDTELAGGLKMVREKLKGTAKSKQRQALNEMDANYPKYLVVKKAGAKAKQNEGKFTAKQLMESAGTVGGETRTFAGEAPLQDIADRGLQTVGRETPSILLDALKGFIPNIQTWQGGYDALGRSLIGETGAQKAGQEFLKNSKIAEALRSGVPLTGTGLNE